MSQTARQLGYEFTKPQINQILWALNDSRENMENDDQMFNRYKKINENFYPVGVEYIKRLHASNCLDFSSLLSETIRLFNEFPSVLQAAQNKWKYFQVDEVQDTNYAQFKIIEMLSAHTKNVFVVGDLDQSIYGWRGARVENIRDFTKLYPETKVISLGKNYRSTPEIIKVADKLIKFNTDRIAAPFVTDNPSGPPVKCSNFVDDKDEAKFIAETVQKMVNQGECNYDDIAIFYRTNNMSRAIEMAMINYNIPHTLIGGFSFFDRREVKDCLSMLKFLVNPLDGVSFHRFCNKPKRALGDVTVGKIEIFANYLPYGVK
jgi:DNA helicase-2/ATP-dependent DNA helicase PcrA